MESWTYRGCPVEEFEHVKNLVQQLRRVRQEENINNNVEMKITSKGGCHLTKGGKGLLKKLGNAVVCDEVDGDSYVVVFVKN